MPATVSEVSGVSFFPTCLIVLSSWLDQSKQSWVSNLSKPQLAKNIFLLPSSLTESISMLKNNLETKTASLLTGTANWYSDIQSPKRRHHHQLWITLPNTNSSFSVKAARVNTCISWWHSRYWMSWHNPCRSPSQIRQKHRVWRQKHAIHQCSVSRTLYSALVVSTKHTR